jgi:hypothetical protein
MLMKKFLLVLTAILAFGIARAEEPKTTETPKTEAKKDNNALTPEKLGAMLHELGYEPKDISLNNKKDIYTITTEKDNWKIYISVSLSNDLTTMWLDVNFHPLEDLKGVQTDAWLKLLELSHENDPIHFTLDAKKRIHVAMPRDNFGITPAVLRKEIEKFDATVRQTEPYWKTANFVYYTKK